MSKARSGSPSAASPTRKPVPRAADRGPRYSKADQIVRLLLALQSSRIGLTLDDIRERFQISERTAQRMKNAAARVMGNELIEETGPDRKSRWRLPLKSAAGLAQVTAEDIADLHAAAKLLRREGQRKRADALESLAEKLGGSVDDKTSRRLDPDIEALLEAEGLAMRPGPRPIIRGETIEELRKALLACRRIYFRYRSRRTGRSTGRAAEPYGFLFGSRHYLVARVPDARPEFRIFSLADIEHVTVQGDSFERDPSFRLQDFAANAFGVFQEDPVDVVWRFKPRAAPFAVEWIFHPTQKMEKHEDGSLTVRFRAGGLKEMAWHVYTWGGDLEVLEPAALAEMCRTHRVHIGDD
jgi:predicted DNA-binding transcriptional regulator YafY